MPRHFGLTCAVILAASLALAPIARASELSFQGTFGNPTLSSPWGAACDASGNLYIMEYQAASDVAMFDRNHNFLGRFGGGTLGWATNLTVAPNGQTYIIDSAGIRVFDAVHNLVQTFSGPASGPSFGITADAASNIYVTDTANNAILKYSPTGTLLQTIAPTGATAFAHPYGVAVDAGGSLYVADSFNNRVEIFDSAGTYQRSFSTAIAAWPYNHPCELTLGTDGKIYLTEDNGIAAYSNAGSLLETYGPSGFWSTPTSVVLDGNTLYGIDRDPTGSTTTIHNRVAAFAIAAPEPASLAILAVGAAAMLARRRR